MNKLFNSKLLIIGSLFSVVAMAKVDLPLKGVYAPAQGYDDNDSVVVTIDSELPNSCYSQSMNTASVNPQTPHVINVHQYGERRTDGVCAADDASLPAQLRIPVSIVTEATVGILTQGEYEFSYSITNGVRSRALHVDRAAASTVDNANYATVTNAFAPAFVPTNSPTFEVRLTGTLSSSCAEVSDVKTILVGDVVVLLPIVRLTEDYCLPAFKPFYKIVQVQTPATEGRYLLHARSQGGGSKSMLFNVSSQAAR